MNKGNRARRLFITTKAYIIRRTAVLRIDKTRNAFSFDRLNRQRTRQVKVSKANLRITAPAGLRSRNSGLSSVKPCDRPTNVSPTSAIFSRINKEREIITFPL